MRFTPEQLETVLSGHSVRLNEGGMDLIVLRADVFERLRGLLYDDSSWSDEEMDLLAAEDADALGWEGMEAYQDDAQ
jgi:methyl coenzyme M reductase gamma subunit